MKRIRIFFLLFIFIVPLIIPYLRSGFFYTHDGEWAIIRLVEMNREIKDIQIPPQWSGFLNHGYGYPLFLFTYPLPYYIGELIHLVGFGFVDSIKIVFVLSIFGSAFFMYLLGKRWWGKIGGFITAIFYLYAPFRLIDLFVRGSVGESVAFVFFPLLFLLGEDVVKKRSKQSIAFFSIVLGALLITHNVFALLFIPLLGIYLLFFSLCQKKYSKSIIALVLGVWGGLGVSTYFWLPALLEQRYTILSQGILNRPEKFIPFFQLFSFFPPKVELPIFIGVVHIIVFVGGLFFLKRSKEQWRLRILGGIALFVLALMTPISIFFWANVPLYSSIDFSWRLLGPFSFILSLGAGFFAKSKFRFILLLVSVIALFFTSRSLLVPQEFFDKGDQFYETNDATTTAFDELMPIWVQKNLGEWPEEKIITPKNATISVLKNKSNKLLFELSLQEQSIIDINTLYFPGWKASVNEKDQEILIHEKKGTIQLDLPKGEHIVALEFTQTLVRKIGNIFSVVFGLFMLILILWNKKRKVL